MSNAIEALAQHGYHYARTEHILVRFDTATQEHIIALKTRFPTYTKSGIMRAAVIIGLDSLERNAEQEERDDS